MSLIPGVYENLINDSTQKEIQEAESSDLSIKKTEIDDAESPKLLADYISQAIQKKLSDNEMSIAKKVDFINKIIKNAGIDDSNYIVDHKQMLSEIITKSEEAERSIKKLEPSRPISGFRVSNLFTGGKGLQLQSEIIKDIESADNICMIVSFLKLSGVRLIIDSLKKFCSKEGHTLRIITTTYCGVTDGKAVEQLSQLPNTEIRISYNATIERLHAKSYIFHRNSGLSTAYIGSSNLSRSAQTDGLEWNIRVTNVENSHILKTAQATFDIYWESKNFEDFNDGGIAKFNEEAKIQRNGNNEKSTDIYQRYILLPHQKTILEKLSLEREAGCHKNLIVAATGTGKTIVSAFDYREFSLHNKQKNRLLFIAHREEILKQSLRAYRSVLQDYNFGSIWTGKSNPDGTDYLFVSIQTFNSKRQIFQNLGKDYYDYIVIDEAHHSKAGSYRNVFDLFQPKLLVGLTATPERMDGQSLLPDFDGHISAEIRLPQALDDGLLTPFQYLCISDITNYSDDLLWKNGKYDVELLTKKLIDQERTALIVQKLKQYLPDECDCRALCFCASVEHAKFLTEDLRKYGFKVDYLVGESNVEHRNNICTRLANKEINYLCVVDIFNEGVDIPEVDTVLFLRPTESLTIFLQQLGRGLRLSPGKQMLTVLDFVGQANKQYDFTSRFRSLLTRTDKSVEHQVKNGFTFLPQGCSIHMEELAQQYVLENIHAAIYNSKRLIKELSLYEYIPTLGQFINMNGQDVRLIFKNGNCWSSLKKAAGKCYYKEDAITQRLEKGMGNLIHTNILSYIEFVEKMVESKGSYRHKNDEEYAYAIMLYYALFQDRISKIGFTSIYEAFNRLESYPIFLQEMKEIMQYLKKSLSNKTFSISDDMPRSLKQYGCYTKEEVFAVFGRQQEDLKMQGAASGIYKINELNTELFFVTLNKSEKDFSPTTLYDDYVISESKFHMQSQNTDSHSGSGSRFVDQTNNHKRFLLFVRDSKKDGYGNTSPYYCFGFVNYIRSYGDCPMNIEWEVEKPILPQFIRVA